MSDDIEAFCIHILPANLSEFCLKSYFSPVVVKAC